jgi:hypothetical protein
MSRPKRTLDVTAVFDRACILRWRGGCVGVFEEIAARGDDIRERVLYPPVAPPGKRD